MYEKLTVLLQDFPAGEYGQLVVDHENDGTMEHPIHLPYVRPGRVMRDFETAVYDFVEQHPDMKLTRYEEILEESGIKWSGYSMKTADVTELDGRTVMALLVGAVRAERFSDGALLAFFEDGSVKKWLMRLQEIDQADNKQESEKKMNRIRIEKISITDAGTDCIVNAANSYLQGGSGVCGAIFNAAGWDELQKACDAIGHCDTGSAVITPAFKLNAKYIIHAVGPVWHGGTHHEPQLLYSCYQASLKLAEENNCHSIAFPLISAGIYGYPKDQAWRKALQACNDYLDKHPDRDLDIVFAVLDPVILQMGKDELQRQMK